MEPATVATWVTILVGGPQLVRWIVGNFVSGKPDRRKAAGHPLGPKELETLMEEIRSAPSRSLDRQEHLITRIENFLSHLDRSTAPDLKVEESSVNQEIQKLSDLLQMPVQSFQPRPAPAYLTRLIEEDPGQLLEDVQPFSQRVLELNTGTDYRQLPVVFTRSAEQPPLMGSLPLDRLEEIQTGLPLVRRHFVDLSSRLGREVVPRCQECRSPLLQTEQAEPAVLQGSGIEIKCPDGHVSKVAARDLFLANLGLQAIIWNAAGFRGEIEARPPEVVQLRRGEILYRWPVPPPDVASGAQFLRIRTPGLSVEPRLLEDVFFPRLLVPGDWERFRGVPVIDNWLFVIEEPGEIEREQVGDLRSVRYQGLTVRGVPGTVSRTYTGEALVHEPGLAVGLFPSPEIVPASWRTYRVFLHGDSKERYSLKLPPTKGCFPWVREYRDEPPRYLSLSHATDRQLGVSFFRPENRRPTRKGSETLRMSLDFGATSSLLYCDRGAHGQSLAARLRPVQVFEREGVVEWLAQSSEPARDPVLGSFLPGADLAASSPYGHEIFEIPSELWADGDARCIRWSDRHPPTPDSRVRTELKWTRDARVRTREDRRFFLRELLLVGLPLVCAEARGGHSTKSVELAFGLPVAFQSSKEVLDMLSELEKELAESTSLRVRLLGVDESTASVLALSSHCPDTTYLIADLGGQTLDVILFTVGRQQKITLHQKGSIELGSEQCFDAIAEVLNRSERKRRSRSRELRDLARQRRLYQRYGTNYKVQRIIGRFIALALELVRVMICAHRHHRPGDNVRVLLMGGGWDLVSVLEAEEPRVIFAERYTALFELLDLPHAEVVTEGIAEDLPSPTHLVAHGALAGLLKSGGGPLSLPEGQSQRLPMGRDVTFGGRSASTIAWHQLVGVDLPLKGLRGKRTSPLPRQGPPPDISETWLQYLQEQFSCAHPQDLFRISQNELTYQLEQILSEGPPVKAHKSLLQLIFEQQVAVWLKG